MIKDILYAYSDTINESFDKGRDYERTLIALDTLADNMPIEEIAKYSHLPKEKVIELQMNMAIKVAK